MFYLLEDLRYHVFSSNASNEGETFTLSTWVTDPVARALDPISTTSTGSLSPLHFTIGCSTLGSSHVCGRQP